jgi:hypothetical protein
MDEKLTKWMNSLNTPTIFGVFGVAMQLINYEVWSERIKGRACRYTNLQNLGLNKRGLRVFRGGPQKTLFVAFFNFLKKLTPNLVSKVLY